MATRSEFYEATLSVMGSAKTLMVTAENKTATVQDALNMHGHTLTLRLKAGPPPSSAWKTVAGPLQAVSPPSYSVALCSPGTLSGSGTAVAVAAVAGSGPLVDALASGGTLVVTLGVVDPPPTTPWATVAAILASLDGVTFGADITCVD